MLELLLTTPRTLHPLDSDYTLTRTLAGLTTLTFTLSSGDEILPKLREEGLIRDTSDGQTYRIRGIHILPEETQLSARLQLDDWESSAVTSFARKSATADGILGEILPQNWSLRCLQTSTDTRDVELEFGGTPLDIAQKVQELFSCALSFDNLSRVLTLSFPQSLPVSDTVLTESADLLSPPEYTGKSTSLATRIYPVGANNVTIESVNDGKPYVENFTYTNRVISKIWKDERYTIPAHLKAAAQEMVDSLCQPEISWEISIRDLYRQDPQRWQGHRAVLGQRIRVSWRDRMITAMIVEEAVHPLYPARNTICIGAAPQTTIGAVGLLKSRLENPNSAYNSALSATISAKIRNITPGSIGAVSTGELETAVNTAVNSAVDSAVNTAQSQRFDGKFLHIAYSYVNGGGATNSREHYEHCARNDYDAVKTDLRLTSDNQLVCCHDAGLTFNDSGYIISYNADNATVIHNITKEQFLSFTFNSSYNGSHCHTCDLETYLNICKTYGKIAYINIRGEYISETVTALIAALKKLSFGMENVIVNSFTMDALTAARAAESGLYLSLVIDPFTESQRTAGRNYALQTGACQICLYYSSGSHTLNELTGDSTVTGWISDAINAGIRLVGAQVNSESEITTLLNLGLIGAQTRLSRLTSADALDITNLEMAAVSGDSATTLTLTDGKGNRKSAEIPKLTLSDQQVQSGVESWMDANAKPTTVWSKNVYNPADSVSGYIASAGQINASTSYWTTGFIPVNPGDVLTLSKSGAKINAYYQAAYDSGKALVSRNSGNANTYTVPAGAAYARFSIKLSAAATTDPVMICINNTDLSYEEYGSHTEGGLGAYLILQSPSGRNFTLKVSDDGGVSAEEVF